MPRPQQLDDSEVHSGPPAPAAPDVFDEDLDLDWAAARGGSHRRHSHGWWRYTAWLLVPLLLALGVAGLSSVTPPVGTPYAGDGIEPSPYGTAPIPSAAPVPSLSTAGDRPPSSLPTTPTTLLASPVSPDEPGLTGGLGVPAASVIPPSAEPAALPVAMRISREAEATTLGAKLSIKAVTDASGGLVVVGLGQTPDSVLTFGDITVPATGIYHIGVWYAASVGALLEIATSAGSDTVLTCLITLGGISRCDTTVKLAVGANSITVRADLGLTADVDRITVW